MTTDNLWYCCACGDGPLSITMDNNGANCGSHRCYNCPRRVSQNANAPGSQHSDSSSQLSPEEERAKFGSYTLSNHLAARGPAPRPEPQEGKGIGGWSRSIQGRSNDQSSRASTHGSSAYTSPSASYNAPASNHGYAAPYGGNTKSYGTASSATTATDSQQPFYSTNGYSNTPGDFQASNDPYQYQRK